MKTKQDFKWRIMLQLNMADCSDNIWASCFQVRDLVSIFVSSVVEMNDCFTYPVTVLSFILTNRRMLRRS